MVAGLVVVGLGGEELGAAVSVAALGDSGVA